MKEHKRGDTILWTCTYKDSAGVAIDITGMSIRVQAKQDSLIDTNLFDVSIGSGITVTDATAGEYTIKVSDTTAYVPDEYSLDVQYTDTQSNIISTETIQFKIVIDITR